MSAQTQEETSNVSGVDKSSKQNKYEKHGYPRPNNNSIFTIDMLKSARDRANDCSGIMTKYLRDYHVGVIRDKKHGHIISNRVVKGQPFAAMIAFVDENDDLLIGWSKRHPGKVVKFGGNTFPAETFNPADHVTTEMTLKDVEAAAREVDIEPLPFSKKDAVTVALLRAMTDTLRFKEGSSTVRTADNKFVPKCIERMLPHFIKRAESYFKKTATNVNP